MEAARAAALLSVVALLAASAGAFNLAPEFARVFPDPRGDSKSYFGFSVALRKHGDSAEVIVGAPRASGSSNLSLESRPGDVYVCNTEGKKLCIPLLPDGAGILKTANVSDKESSGLGTVVVTQDTGNAILMCAPRWKNNEVCGPKQDPFHSRINGICYLTNSTTYPVSRVTPLHPFTKCDGQFFKRKYYFAFAEAGMSVQIVKNMSEIILGAPGISNWKGIMLRYRFGDNSSLGTDIPCPTCYVMQEYSYFGYAVSYGKFTHSKGISYVSSAPRAAENRGKVLVFNFEKATPWSYRIIKQREGTQLGEYFGASLCVADFNNDGLDDLLVGAPQHSVKSNNGDEGCIYVLLSTENDWKDLGIIAGSDQRGARFGTAMALLGDINMDGYPDVAVGAPYENDRQGAIYIYHGNKYGLNVYHSQKIKPAEKLFLRGFGASISKGLDVDGNCINDIAVGAYISGHVVLIRAYPVVTILPELIPKDRKITFTTETFDGKFCFSFREKYKSLKVGVAISVKVDQHFKRVSFEKDIAKYTSHFNITLESMKQHCQHFILFIQNKTEFSKSIELFVEYKLIMPAPFTYPKESKVLDSKSDTFCKHCAVINPEKQQWKKLYIQYIPDSEPADLKVKANFLNVKSPFIIGTTDTIEFEVLLQNEKGQAMETCILITFQSVPLSLLKQIPTFCQVNAKELINDILELVCDIRSPFYGKEPPINIILDMKELPTDLTKLNISVMARSISLEEFEEDNKANLSLSLERSFDLEIHGKSVEYSFVKNELELNDDELEQQQQHASNTKDFKHSYQVINNGPSPAANIELYFQIPTFIRRSGVPVEVLNIKEQVAYLEQQPISCVPVDEFMLEKHQNYSTHDEIQFPSNRTYILNCSEIFISCAKIKCTINSLSPGSSGAKIAFSLEVMTEKIGAAMGLKDIILIKTFGQISSEERYPKVLSGTEVTSVVWTKPPTTKFDMGMIAVGVACGCLILVTLILLLVKCGFFTRLDPTERYFRKKAALALESNSIPASTFYSPRGSIMVF